MNEPLVSTSAVSKRYGDVTALDRVDLVVRKGSVYGLVGPNGAGKTTMLAILAGLRKPSDGTTRIDTASVAVLPDTPQFDGWLTGREVVALSLTLQGDTSSRSAVDDVLGIAGLTEDADRKVRGYSRGMLQRLGLAAAVVTTPDLLLLDEPAAALDPAGRREVLNLVSAMKGRSTVLFSSHILDDVAEVCDDIGILRRGEMVYQGSLDGLLRRYVGRGFGVRLRSGADDVKDALLSEPWVTSVGVGPDETLAVVVSDVAEAERRLVQVLAASGHPVVSVTQSKSSLEQVFLEVTK
ncbi:MAG: ABC transporter ATP-binding protein [Acidimicrobiia bacterium]